MTRLAQVPRIAPLVVMLALTSRGSAQVIPTAGAPPGPRTGMIVGQVVDAATGAPVAEAIVRLTMPKYFENPTTPKGRVMADGEGRFFFTDLPPGEYFLQATKDGYAPGTYGQRRAWGQSQLLSLAEGERPTDVTLRMWKYGVIAGTVVDEAGEPVVGVAVRALIKDVFAGRTRYGNMEVIPELVPTATTDDRGMFRLSQLMPGTYVVLVPSTQTTLPAAFLEAPDATLRSRALFRGCHRGGAARAASHATGGRLRPADVESRADSSAAVAGGPHGRVPDDVLSGRGDGWCGDADRARSRRGADGRLNLGAAGAGGARLRPPRDAGRIGSAADHHPAGRRRDDRRHYERPGHRAGPRRLRDRHGHERCDRPVHAARRAARRLRPHARQPFLSRAIQQGQPAYWISQRVTVGDDDLPDLVVALRPALRVEGRIEFRGGSGPPPRSSGSRSKRRSASRGSSRRRYARRNAFVFHRRRRRPGTSSGPTSCATGSCTPSRWAARTSRTARSTCRRTRRHWS